MGAQETNIEKIILRVGSKYMSGTKVQKILTGKFMGGDVRWDCKMGYMYMDKECERICNKFKGVQRDRIVRILSGIADFEERKMFYSNYFISIKFLLRDSIKHADTYNYLARFYDKQINEAKSKNDLVCLKEYQMLDKINKDKIAQLMRFIKIASEFLIVALKKYEGLFTDHEIAQVFSCSFNKVKEAHQRYDILKKENKIQGGFLINAILNFDIENRGDYKGRHKGIQNCPSVENPFFTTIILGNADKILES